MIGKIDDGIMQRGLAGADRKGRNAAFELRDPTLENVGRRVADPAVAEPGLLEIEEGGAMVGAVEFVGDGLIDRNCHRLGGRVAPKTAVYGNGFPAHAGLRGSFSVNVMR